MCTYKVPHLTTKKCGVNLITFYTICEDFQDNWKIVVSVLSEYHLYTHTHTRCAVELSVLCLCVTYLLRKILFSIHKYQRLVLYL